MGLSIGELSELPAPLVEDLLTISEAWRSMESKLRTRAMEQSAEQARAGQDRGRRR